jgi:hypothetical protein
MLATSQELQNHEMSRMDRKQALDTVSKFGFLQAL